MYYPEVTSGKDCIVSKKKTESFESAVKWLREQFADHMKSGGTVGIFIDYPVVFNVRFPDGTVYKGCVRQGLKIVS